jgi:hypothetical protein
LQSAAEAGVATKVAASKTTASKTRNVVMRL